MNFNKKISLIAGLFIATIFCCSSCKREVEDRLPGNWNYSETGISTILYNGVTNTEDVNKLGTATFIDDGTGSITVGSTVSSISWSASNDTINITKDGVAINYFVTNNEKTLQEWEAKHEEHGVDYTFTTEVKITLTQ